MNMMSVEIPLIALVLGLIFFIVVFTLFVFFTDTGLYSFHQTMLAI